MNKIPLFSVYLARNGYILEVPSQNQLSLFSSEKQLMGNLSKYISTPVDYTNPAEIQEIAQELDERIKAVGYVFYTDVVEPLTQLSNVIQECLRYWETQEENNND